MSPARRRSDTKLAAADLIWTSGAPEIPLDIVPLRVDAMDEPAELCGVAIGDTRPAGIARTNLVLSQARLSKVDFTESRLTGLRASDAAFENCNFSNVRLAGAALSRVLVSKSKLSGIQCGESVFSDVEFRECSLDYASFASATFKRVTFDTCRLREAEFSATAFERVRFVNCDLVRATFRSMRLKRTEMRNCALEALRGLTELRGVAMERSDILAHAELFAAELGIEVAAT